MGILVPGGAHFTVTTLPRGAHQLQEGWQASEGLQDIFENVLKHVREEEAAQAKRMGKGMADEKCNL